MKRTVIAVLAAFGLVLTAVPASAASTTITVPFKHNQITWFTTPRTITVAGSDIDARVALGGVMQMAWYKCGDRNTRGAFVTMEEHRKHVGTNFRAGTRFCLASNSLYTEGTVGGTLWWSGH
ncbi:hypothetical protein FKR81_26045 [Lentzea tibetensis]|uniref:Uncharacterized protein n=1 Tax=Lentzea tibetensis TaxID=2591470 RepID=A0A563EPA8_9PSEU|nr:hypothetical protein [Lentzea tibetensis]TWP49131.1 hypothetical protein FKR81_26045 [Lentzea tibetensis]